VGRTRLTDKPWNAKVFEGVNIDVWDLIPGKSVLAGRDAGETGHKETPQ